jgi:hypothetical protein
LRASIQDAGDLCGVENVFAGFEGVTAVMEGLGSGFKRV